VTSRRGRRWRRDHVQTGVRIERPIEEVFAHVSDPLNFRWNSAVRAVHSTSGLDGDVGSTYAMERALPTVAPRTVSRSWPVSAHGSLR
jgi:hypothetical protein